MKYCFDVRNVALCFIVLFVIGCGKGGDYSPVSGVVTVDGQPTAKVRVVFAPMATEGSNESGPASVGITDETGRFVLEARDGNGGAVAGTHRVSFKYSDLKLLSDLKFARGRAATKEKAAEYQAEIDHVESETKRRGAISRKSMTKMLVPEAGLENADFEIGEKK